MDEYQPSEKVRAILRAAASTPELLEILVKDREKALARMGLSPEEKAALMSLSDQGLLKMVKRGQTERGTSRALGSRVLMLVVIVAALALFASFTGDKPARRVKAVLIQLSIAEGVYELNYGAYGSLEDLVRAGALTSDWVGSELEGNEDYEFEIVLQGDTFAATARHRTQPYARPGFRVGPGGRVEPLE